MKKLTVKNIIEFRKKTDNGKKKIVADLKSNIEKPKTEGGGNYWIHSVSAISNAFKAKDTEIIKAKIDILTEKLNKSQISTSKAMYQQNINILYAFEDIDFKKWYPAKDSKCINKFKNKSVLTLKGLQVQAIPQHLITFKKNGAESLGAIWFVAKKEGFSNAELGIYTEIMYKYLTANNAGKYNISPKFCIAMDVVTRSKINYEQIQKGQVDAILNSTLNEINRMMA